MTRPARLLVPLLALMTSLLALLPGLAPAASADDGTYGGLSPRQADVVLDLIDDVCGDTWCEGDVAFDFRAFACDTAARTCALTARLAPYDDGPRHWYRRTGTVHGFVRFGQMVERRGDGSFALRWDFYLAVSDAVDRMEASLPRPS